MKLLKNIGELLAIFSIIGFMIGVILVVFFHWTFDKEWPPKLVPPEVKEPILNGQEIETSTAYPLASPETVAITTVEAFATNTSIPINGNWVVQGDGKVVAAKDYVLIYAADKTSAHTRDTDFHNIYLVMDVDVVRLDDQGSYSLLLRRADPCQLYDVRFSNINEKRIQIELRKYFCEDGYALLNRVEVAVNAYEPYRLSASIVGGEVVYFSISINDVEELKVQDTNDFIWRGDFGVSVENGEVQFLDIKMHE